MFSSKQGQTSGSNITKKMFWWNYFCDKYRDYYKNNCSKELFCNNFGQDGICIYNTLTLADSEKDFAEGSQKVSCSGCQKGERVVRRVLRRGSETEGLQKAETRSFVEYNPLGVGNQTPLQQEVA